MGDVTSALHVLTSNIGSSVSYLRLVGTRASPTIGPTRVYSEVVAPNVPDEIERRGHEDKKAQGDANVAPPLEDPERERHQPDGDGLQNRTEPVDRN